MSTVLFRKNRQSVHNKSGVLMLVKITMADEPEVFALCSGVKSVVSQGITYVPFGFYFNLPSDVEGENPSSQLAMENLGAEFVALIERIVPGANKYNWAELIIADNATPDLHEWSCKMPMNSVSLNAEVITSNIGHDIWFRLSGNKMRHDPETSPGLYT